MKIIDTYSENGLTILIIFLKIWLLRDIWEMSLTPVDKNSTPEVKQIQSITWYYADISFIDFS